MKGRANMSVSEQINILQQAFEHETEQLNSMPEEEAKVVATANLIRVGVLDKNGNPTPMYAAIM